MLPQVQHGGHFHSVGDGIQRGRITFRVRSQNDDAARSGDGVVIEEALRRAREHDSGQVIATEDSGLLVSALGDDDIAGSDFHQAFRRDQSNPVVGVVARGVRARQKSYTRIAADGCDERLGSLGIVRSSTACVEATATRGRILIDEQHRCAPLRRRQRGSKARRSRSNNQDIAEIVALGCAARRSFEVNLAQAREVAEHPLPVREPALAVERLVVKADRQKGAETVEDRQTVPRESAARIDSRNVPTRLNRNDVSTYVRHASAAITDLHHRVDIVSGGTQQAARPMVFEGAAENPHTLGGERGTDGVAAEAADPSAFESELHRRATIDALSFDCGQAAHELGPAW